jgi:plastocyanin
MKTLIALIILAIAGGFFVFRPDRAVAPDDSTFPRTDTETSARNASSTSTPAPAAATDAAETQPTEAAPEEAAAMEKTTAEQKAPRQVAISFTDSGFSPARVDIARSDTVIFTNASSRHFWPASDIHPTHRLYPDSDIKKCGTPEEPRLFDACRAIAPGGSYAFTFTEAGEWKYHDHLSARETGVVAVR